MFRMTLLVQSIRESIATTDPIQRFQMSMLALVLLTLLGTVAYVQLEDMTWVDAFYMTVITIATVWLW